MWLLCVGTVRALGASESIIYFRGTSKTLTPKIPAVGIFAIGNGGRDRGDADPDGCGNQLDRRHRLEIAADGE